MTDLDSRPVTHVSGVEVDPAPIDDAEVARDRRMQHLLAGLSELRQRSGESGVDGERLLFLLGAIFAPLGMLLIGIGWYGAAGSGLVYQQIPFLVSGGLAGLAFVFAGCTLYACWWATRLIREQRERHAEIIQKQDAVLAALLRIADERSPVGGDR